MSVAMLCIGANMPNWKRPTQGGLTNQADLPAAARFRTCASNGSLMAMFMGICAEDKHLPIDQASLRFQ